MWTARALMRSGEDAPLQLSQVEGRHASMLELVLQARELTAESGVAIPWHLLDAALDSGPLPWGDAIPAWAPGATQSNAGFSVRPLGGNSQNLVLESEERGLQVWHETTAVVVLVPGDAVQLAINYEWDHSVPVPPFVEYGPNAEGELLPTLDGRLYAGEKSVVLETDDLPSAWKPMMPHGSGPRFRWYFSVANRAGLFIGRIVRRLVRRPSPIVHDPGFLARLADEETQLGTPDSCPRIEALQQDGAAFP